MNKELDTLIQTEHKSYLDSMLVSKEPKVDGPKTSKETNSQKEMEVEDSDTDSEAEEATGILLVFDLFIIF